MLGATVGMVLVIVWRVMLRTTSRGSLGSRCSDAPRSRLGRRAVSGDEQGDRLPHLELRRTLNGFSRRVCSERRCRAGHPTIAASTTR